MLYEFRSRATGTVVMTSDVAEPLLRAIGKEPGPTGIVTVAQLPDAIAMLERAVAQSRQDEVAQRDDRPRVGATTGGAFGGVRGVEAPRHPTPDADDDEAHRAPTVSFGQRAWPLLDMMRAANAAGRDVVWGV